MSRISVVLAVLVSGIVGAAGGLMLTQADPSNGQRKDVKSITGVSSGVDGSQVEPLDAEGVEQIPLAPETTPPLDPTDPPPDADANNQPQSQTVDLQGVDGTEGVDTPPEYSVEIITTDDGSMQSIRGIQGIDTVLLQNLESVLRMQAPPPPPTEGGGGARAAAALTTMETDEPLDPEQEIDGREELTEFELKGS